MPFTGLLAWRRPAPPPARLSAPAKPEWERLAEEIIGARHPAGLDPVVFGDWPGTYYPAAVNWRGGGPA